METSDQKKEKRRLQNVEAAKKSYESKKKERCSLQEKNAQLTEQQKQLLIDKSRLSDECARLESIYNQMQHACKHHHHTNSRRQVYISPVLTDLTCPPGNDVRNGYSVNGNLHYNDNTVLDLSSKGSHVTQDPMDHENNHYADQYCIDTLDLGATQEVEVTAGYQKKTRKASKKPNSDAIFVPENVAGKKLKSSHLNPSSCARYCKTSHRNNQPCNYTVS
ncbi:uncharacterized protein LOC131957813 isoform X2 [Physella acuta]|nr:uncharacterized protein LOC131957813 isoform X2 [Physella acuta]XP_059178594.1 uncharacterized protein LOC131957813 isoform X2 [Physella acuta]XP_059178595.1 uncharacterized protein LOC131957813 isoform X2 [Physella acuta]